MNGVLVTIRCRNSTFVCGPTTSQARNARSIRASASSRVAPCTISFAIHRIVERRDRIALTHAAVDAHRRARRRLADDEFDALRQTQIFERAGGRQKTVRRILGIEAGFDRVAGRAQIVLLQRQRFAGRDPQLPFDEVEPRHHFGHRMFDLQARIHFHEIEIAGPGHDELDRARADVTHRPRGGHRGVAHLTAQPVGKPGARGASSSTF